MREINKTKIDSIPLTAYKLPFNAIAYSEPTNNCQVFSIGNFDALLGDMTDIEINVLLDIIYRDYFEKCIMLIDVNHIHCKRVKEFLKKK